MTAGDAAVRVSAWLGNELAVRGLTLRRLERDSGVSFKTLQRVLDGEPFSRRDRRAALANALGYRGDALDLVERGEEPVSLAPDHGPGDIIDVNSDIARLPPEDRQTVLDLIKRLTRDLEEGR